MRPFFRKRRLLALLCVTLTIGAGWLVQNQTSSWCEALGHYRGLRISDLKSFFFWVVLYAPAILLLGTWAYRKMRARWTFLNTTRGTVVYFVGITIVAFPLQFAGLEMDVQERRCEAAICDKSTSNGMFTESQGLSVEEYEYLRTLNPLFPLVPKGADSLRVNYYSDGFLPDFSLRVACSVDRRGMESFPAYDNPGKDGPKGWMLDTARVDPNIAWLVYEDSES